jgi:hypothetical protein
MRDAFLDDDRAQAPADPRRGPAAWVSSLAPEVPVPSGSTARNGTVAAVCLVPPLLTLLAIRLVTLVCALILGQASTSESLAARGEAPPPDGPVQAATAVTATPSCSVTRSVRIRPHHGTNVVPHFLRPRSDDPNDDTTSDDPNDDDDAWDDLNADDNTHVPVIAWRPEIVRYLIDLEAGYAPASTRPPSSPFPTLQRLRC